MDHSKITQKEPELNRMWESVVSVPGTRGVHCISVLNYGHITAARYSEKAGIEHHLLLAEEESVPTASAMDTEEVDLTDHEMDTEETFQTTPALDIPTADDIHQLEINALAI